MIFLVANYFLRILVCLLGLLWRIGLLTTHLFCGKNQEIKEEEKPAFKTSLGKIDCCNRLSVSNTGRMSLEVKMEMIEAAQPTRASSSLNGYLVRGREK